MTIQQLLRSLHAEIETWLNSPRYWARYDRFPESEFQDQFNIQIVKLKALLGEAGRNVQALDLDEAWREAIFELRTLTDFLTQCYRDDRVSPAYALWDRDPPNGPKSLQKLLAVIDVFSEVFCGPNDNTVVSAPDFSAAKKWQHLYEYFWQKQLSDKNSIEDFQEAIREYRKKNAKNARKNAPVRVLPGDDLKSAKSVRKNYLDQVGKLPVAVGTSESFLEYLSDL